MGKESFVADHFLFDCCAQEERSPLIRCGPGRQIPEDEVSMEMTELTRSSVTSGSGAVQGDHGDETRVVGETTPRQREADTPKTAATKRRKRPIPSSYNLDKWGTIRGVNGVTR